MGGRLQLDSEPAVRMERSSSRLSMLYRKFKPPFFSKPDLHHRTSGVVNTSLGLLEVVWVN